MRYQGKHSAGVKKRRGFRAQLAKELGVETVPESFRQAMEKTYQELPLDMPVAYRPVRTFLRRTASAAAACGLLFLALLGVNTTYPQLTEALPGLGMVFQAINSRNQEPLDDRSHLMLEAEATPTPVPQPAFRPITVHPNEEPIGDLIIEDAWSDGRYLWLEMSLDLEDASLKETLADMAYDEASGTLQPVFSLSPGSPASSGMGSGMGSGIDDVMYMDVVSDSELILNGIVASLSTSPGFVWDEERKMPTASFYIPIIPAEAQGEVDGNTSSENAPATASSEDLDSSGKKGQELMDISLTIPSLTIVQSPKGADGPITGDSFQPFYNVNFQLEIDHVKNQVMEPMAEDNGVTLRKITYTPSEVILEADLPDIGLGSDLMISSSSTIASWDTSQPLGIYADLVRKPPEGDGSVESRQEDTGTADHPGFYRGGLISLNDESGISYNAEAWGETNHLVYSFTTLRKPENQDSPLVLTFYETPEGSNFDRTGCPDDYNPRVLAEFTIEPSQGLVYTSENYRAEYREKVDISRESAPHGDFENGFLCAGVNSNEDVFLDSSGQLIQLISLEDMTYRNLGILAYRNEETTLFTWQVGSPTEDESGAYYPWEFALSSTGQTAFGSAIYLRYPEEAYKYDFPAISDWFTRLSLVDLDTDQVLIPDLQESAAQARKKALGSWTDYNSQNQSPAKPSSAPTGQPFGPAAPPSTWPSSAVSSQLDDDLSISE